MSYKEAKKRYTALGTDPEAAVRAVADAVKPDPEEMRALFQDPDAGTETENGGEPD